MFLRHRSNRAVEEILQQYERAIRIVKRFKQAGIKLIDCPFLSIVKWNTSKGHPEPESFKESDLRATSQIESLNKEIWKLNSSLGKATIKATKARKVRTSVNRSINKKDGVHPGKFLSEPSVNIYY